MACVVRSNFHVMVFRANNRGLTFCLDVSLLRPDRQTGTGRGKVNKGPATARATQRDPELRQQEQHTSTRISTQLGQHTSTRNWCSWNNTKGPGTGAAGTTHKHSEIGTMHSLVSPIQDTLSVLDLSEDLALIDQINTKLQQMQTLAHHDIDRLGARVENLQRQRENIELSMKSLHTSAQNKSTRSELKRLQNDIFDSARSLTALNMELNTLKLSYNENLRKLDSLDTELGALNDKFLLTTQSQDLPTDADDPEALEANSNLVRLKLFQSLGLKFNPESKEVLILNKSKNNITMLQIDDTYNEYFISNFIWENM